MLQEPRHKTQENQEPIPRPRKQDQDQKQETRYKNNKITNHLFWYNNFHSYLSILFSLRVFFFFFLKK